MNPNTQRLLRIVSLIMFVVGLVILVLGEPADLEDVLAATLSGLALFVGSFIT